jgi:acetyl esterase
MNVEIASFDRRDEPEQSRRYPAVLRTARPDPEVRRLLLQLNLWRGRQGGYSLGETRRDWQLAVKAFASREPVHAVTARVLDGPAGPIRLRIYNPGASDAARPVLVWFHGGGFVAGDLYTAGATCRALANRSGAVVVAVQYRLAPEHSLEVGRADCVHATRWVAAHAAELGGDPLRLAVGGDSAGGTQAAAVAQAWAVGDAPALRLQLLVYPATDLARDYASIGAPGDGHLLGRREIDWMRSEIAKVSDIRDPRLSPLRCEQPPNLAPALVVTAGFDPLCDEALQYVERLRAHGVPVTGLHYPGQVHGFLTFDRVCSGARDALRRIGTVLAAATDARPGRSAEDVGAIAGAIERMRWLTPAQRWNESLVAGLLVGDRLQRGLGRMIGRLSESPSAERRAQEPYDLPG